MSVHSASFSAEEVLEVHLFVVIVLVCLRVVETRADFVVMVVVIFSPLK